jgi:hypothetical protein
MMPIRLPPGCEKPILMAVWPDSYIRLCPLPNARWPGRGLDSRGQVNFFMHEIDERLNQPIFTQRTALQNALGAEDGKVQGRCLPGNQFGHVTADGRALLQAVA